MSIYSKTLFALASLSCLAGCAGVSQTEAEFGNSVRHIVARQQIAPSGTLEADEPIRSGDGRRLESVTTVYQTYVGDPTPVVREMEVDNQQRTAR